MNIFPEFKNKKIVIWGLGTHGNGPAAVKFFSQNGAKILVTDLKTESDLKESLDEIKDIPNIEYVLGEHRESDFLNQPLFLNLLLKFLHHSARKILMRLDHFHAFLTPK